MTELFSLPEMKKKPTPEILLATGLDPIEKYGSSPVVYDFETTRLRLYASKFHKEMEPFLTSLESSGYRVRSRKDLLSESEETLKSSLILVHDFMEVSSRREQSLLRAKWTPFAAFYRGDRVFSMHVSYSKDGVKVQSLTLYQEGKETTTKCSTLKSAFKVGLGVLRSLDLNTNVGK